MLENQKISGGNGCGSYVAEVCGSEGTPVDCTNRYRTWPDADCSGRVEWETAEAGLQLLHCRQILRGTEEARRAEA